MGKPNRLTPLFPWDKLPHHSGRRYSQLYQADNNAIILHRIVGRDESVNLR